MIAVAGLARLAAGEHDDLAIQSRAHGRSTTLAPDRRGWSMTSPTQSDDRIFLRGLAAECIIGFIDWERLVKQTVVLDLEVPVDCRRAARDR